MREFIKNNITNPEIKEKAAMMEARKKIEDNMENFKLWEKEAKTKAFSKEGLAAAKIDKKTEEKLRLKTWLNLCLQRTSELKDLCENEIEQIQNAKYKSSKKHQDEVAKVPSLQAKVEEYEIQNLRFEALLRNLENETITTDAVEELKDGVDGYLADTNDKFWKEKWDKVIH